MKAPIPFLLAVQHHGDRGVAFDLIHGDGTMYLLLVAWASGNVSSASSHDITFVRFLSSETEANIWLKEEE